MESPMCFAPVKSIVGHRGSGYRDTSGVDTDSKGAMIEAGKT